jgi:hypothetical protein
MTTSVRKSRGKPESAQKLVAEKAEEVASVLHSFAATLISLDQSAPPGGRSAPAPTPRNWWKVQAGRFKNDPTFAEFIAQVQAARRHEG